jgi:methanethiol S-methyltransferase
MNETYLLLAWLLYFYLHSLLASIAVKQFFTKIFSIKSALAYRVGYNIFALTGLLLLFGLQFMIRSDRLFITSFITDCFAFFIMMPGLVIMIAAIQNYDWKSFIGITKEKNYALVIAGMNKYVRHPLYSGTMLFATGFLVWQPYYKNLWLFLLMWVYVSVGIIYEEKKLAKIYGDEYKRYQKKVKKVIPFIW